MLINHPQFYDKSLYGAPVKCLSNVGGSLWISYCRQDQRKSSTARTYPWQKMYSSILKEITSNMAVHFRFMNSTTCEEKVMCDLLAIDGNLRGSTSTVREAHCWVFKNHELPKTAARYCLKPRFNALNSTKLSLP